MKIAVDAMGGDRAPGEILHGVSQALERGFATPDDVLLFGRRDQVEPLQREIPALADVELRHADEVVEMGESPTRALRGKPNSSVQVALRSVKEGESGAFLSAGNTGAVVACSLAVLGRMTGVHRPGIAVAFPSVSGPVITLDCGANVHCKPMHLFQYGVMANIVSRFVYQVEAPRIGLLNVGEEEGKGTDLVRKTGELFSQSKLNFVGNVEGNDLVSGRCDIVVCEGFVGNVMLKVVEGIGGFLRSSVQEQLRAAGEGSDLAGALAKFTSKLDYAEYGGAPLLGVNGSVTIMHGRSDRRAVANALRVARQTIEVGAHQHMQEAIGTALGEGPATGGAR